MSNGNGRSNTNNDNDKYLWTGRVMWQALGNVRMNQWGSGALLTEGDLGDSQGKPLLAIAGQFSNNNRFNALAPPAINLENTTYDGDYTFKYKGFASVGEYAYRESKPQALANAAPGHVQGQVSPLSGPIPWRPGLVAAPPSGISPSASRSSTRPA